MSDSEEEFVGGKRKARPNDPIVDQALKVEEEEKRQRKTQKKMAGGKTLAEIEEEEGGPIKESKVGMAHTQRALGRKSGPAKDEAGPVAVEGTDIGRFEEKAEVEEEDGVRFTGFNLNEERETGHFDEQGNYVESKDKGVQDAWMASEEAKVISPELRKKLEARRAEEEKLASQKRAPLTDRQIAELKSELASHMLPGEVLTRALKRISGSNAQQTKAMGKRERMRLQQQQQEQQQQEQQSKKPEWQRGGGQGSSNAPNSQVFTRMTEIADLLVQEGEVDVYDSTKEDYQRFADMWLPKKPAGPPEGTPAAAAAAAADADDDMFGDEGQFGTDRGEAPSTAAPASAPAATAGGGAAAAGAASAAGAGASLGGVWGPGPSSTGEGGATGSGGAAAAAAPPAVGTSGTSEPEIDYSSWPVKELKRCLQERGIDASQIVEKNNLIAKVREVASQPVATGQTYDIPIGYAFDPGSGFFYSPESGVYFDNNSGLYAAGGRWYTVSSDGQFVEYTGS